MSLLHQLKRILVKHFNALHWYSLLYASAVYVGCTWLLLNLCGETELTRADNFFYWLLVTASTVGYGDFSPSTTGGKWVVALFVIPLGLSLFAVLIGNAATYFADQWRKGVKGLKQLNVDNHILIIGWNENRTIQLLNLVLREQKYLPVPSPVVLCVLDNIDNPMPSQIGFVKVGSFNSDAEMSRANIEHASCIILDNAQDDVTMTTALYCHSRNPTAHTIAYLKDENLVSLLKRHCPNIECTPSVSVEMLAKAAVDPGSSLLHRQLLDANMGMTQYSTEYPTNQPARPVQDFFLAFKQHYQATLIGVVVKRGDDILINPDMTHIIEPGSTLYYIADERVTQFDWSLCHV